MTLRAIGLGLLGAAVICGIAYFNDAVMHQTQFIGNNLPIAVYGSLLLFLLLINPLLFFARKTLALSGKELAVILTLTLAAACIPGSGLMRTFTAALVLPYHHARTSPGWQEHHALSQTPSRMLATVTPDNESEVVNGFVQGMGKGAGLCNLDPRRVPWQAWVRPLAFWLPMLLVFWVGLLGLSLVVHRQWADHEQLPYPIAGFAGSLLARKTEVFGGVLRNRLFWLAMVAVLLLHMNNYAFQWYPQLFSRIPLTLDFSSLGGLFPSLVLGGGSLLLTPTIFFTVVAFAFFLATDVSLAVGIGPFLWHTLVGICAAYGISLAAGNPSPSAFLAFGAYFGLLLVLVYTGRRYYAEVLRQALAPRTQGAAPSEAVWGARVFLAAMLVFVVSAVLLGGMDWPIALLYTGGMTLIFLVISRIVAETGVFFVQANFAPTAILLGFFGLEALGPKAILITMIFTMVMLIDPREAFMPFMVNSFKLLDQHQVKVGRVAGMAVAALLIGCAVAVPVTLYFQYARGVNQPDIWVFSMVPKMPFDELVRVEQNLTAKGTLAQSVQVAGLGHFARMKPNPGLMLALAAGMGLVLLFTAGRLRFSKWPIHPVVFLLWTTYPARFVAFSFLLGWAVKAAVMRYGGVALYRTLKPLMIGLIAGEMVAGVLMLITGAAYWGLTGQPPKTLIIMPT